MNRQLLTAAIIALAAAGPVSAQAITKSVAKTTSGGVVAVGSNNGNGNGNQVSNGGGTSGRAPLVSVGSNNGNGNGNQVSNASSGAQGRQPVASVGSHNGNGNGNAVKNCSVADDGGSGMMGSSTGC